MAQCFGCFGKPGREANGPAVVCEGGGAQGHNPQQSSRAGPPLGPPGNPKQPFPASALLTELPVSSVKTDCNPGRASAPGTVQSGASVLAQIEQISVGAAHKLSDTGSSRHAASVSSPHRLSPSGTLGLLSENGTGLSPFSLGPGQYNNSLLASTVTVGGGSKHTNSRGEVEVTARLTMGALDSADRGMNEYMFRESIDTLSTGQHSVAYHSARRASQLRSSVNADSKQLSFNLFGALSAFCEEKNMQQNAVGGGSLSQLATGTNSLGQQLIMVGSNAPNMQPSAQSYALATSSSSTSLPLGAAAYANANAQLHTTHSSSTPSEGFKGFQGQDSDQPTAKLQPLQFSPVEYGSNCATIKKTGAGPSKFRPKAETSEQGDAMGSLLFMGGAIANARGSNLSRQFSAVSDGYPMSMDDSVVHLSSNMNGDWDRGSSLRGGHPKSQARRVQDKAELLAAARRIGAVLPDVVVHKPIGAGAHGKVYKGTMSDRHIAIKVIQHELDAAASAAMLTAARNQQAAQQAGTSGVVDGSSASLDLPIPPEQMRLIEGLVGASAQHPNIVMTYRVVMQSVQVPQAPAFVLSRETPDFKPLWTTQNIVFPPSMFAAISSAESGSARRSGHTAGRSGTTRSGTTRNMSSNLSVNSSQNIAGSLGNDSQSGNDTIASGLSSAVDPMSGAHTHTQMQRRTQGVSAPQLHLEDVNEDGVPTGVGLVLLPTVGGRQMPMSILSRGMASTGMVMPPLAEEEVYEAHTPPAASSAGTDPDIGHLTTIHSGVNAVQPSSGNNALCSATLGLPQLADNPNHSVDSGTGGHSPMPRSLSDSLKALEAADKAGQDNTPHHHQQTQAQKHQKSAGAPAAASITLDFLRAALESEDGRVTPTALAGSRQGSFTAAQARPGADQGQGQGQGPDSSGRPRVPHAPLAATAMASNAQRATLAPVVGGAASHLLTVGNNSGSGVSGSSGSGPAPSLIPRPLAVGTGEQLIFQTPLSTTDSVNPSPHSTMNTQSLANIAGIANQDSNNPSSHANASPQRHAHAGASNHYLDTGGGVVGVATGSGSGLFAHNSTTSGLESGTGVLSSNAAGQVVDVVPMVGMALSQGTANAAGQQAQAGAGAGGGAGAGADGSSSSKTDSAGRVLTSQDSSNSNRNAASGSNPASNATPRSAPDALAGARNSTSTSNNSGAVNFGGRLSNTELQYSKLSWSNTPTSASNTTAGGAALDTQRAFMQSLFLATQSSASTAPVGRQLGGPSSIIGRNSSMASRTTAAKESMELFSGAGVRGPSLSFTHRSLMGLASNTEAHPGRHMWQTFLVQELCTRGNLKEAISAGTFHLVSPLPVVIGPDGVPKSGGPGVGLVRHNSQTGPSLVDNSAHGANAVPEMLSGGRSGGSVPGAAAAAAGTQIAEPGSSLGSGAGFLSSTGHGMAAALACDTSNTGAGTGAGAGANAGGAVGSSPTQHSPTRSPNLSAAQTPSQAFIPPLGGSSGADVGPMLPRTQSGSMGSVAGQVVPGTVMRMQTILLGHLIDTAMEVASAMVYLHSKRLMHGDLKTQNVLLQANDADPRGFICKLADFGTARLMSHGQDELLVSRFGTVTHQPPETIRDNIVSMKGDVYSFGVLMWEIYCAQQPFANYTTFQLLSAVVQFDERPQFPSHCPPGYAALAQRCMSKLPEQRPDFTEVLAALAALRQSVPSMLVVPLAEARAEANRILASHLQIAAANSTSVSERGTQANNVYNTNTLVSGDGGGAHTTQGTNLFSTVASSWDERDVGGAATTGVGGGNVGVGIGGGIGVGVPGHTML